MRFVFDIIHIISKNEIAVRAVNPMFCLWIVVDLKSVKNNTAKTAGHIVAKAKIEEAFLSQFRNADIWLWPVFEGQKATIF